MLYGFARQLFAVPQALSLNLHGHLLAMAIHFHHRSVGITVKNSLTSHGRGILTSALHFPAYFVGRCLQIGNGTVLVARDDFFLI